MSGVHGEIADAVVDTWGRQGLPSAIKWVDDGSNSREPAPGRRFVLWYSEGLFWLESGSCNFIEICYNYDKVTMLAMIADLQVPWHLTKGQDFDFVVEYVGFVFNLLRRTVSIPEQKWIKFAKAAASPPQPKPKPPPLPNPSDECLLVRFDGQVPPLLGLPYPDILAKINESLAPLGLPLLMYTQKQSESSIFVVPHSKDDLRILTERWDIWAPSVFPGGRIAPVATHCFIQVNGVVFSGAGSLEELGREFELRNPQLGPVVGTPAWVNKPPSEAKAAAMVVAGRTPPKAGSLFVRLSSRDMVDKAVASGRVVLAGTAPAVGRGFPHLRVVQCWGCLKFGHTHDRCSSLTKCGGCGKENHGAVCLDKPVCVNCDGVHRADSFACPARRWIAEQLRLRAAELCKTLDAQSRFITPKTASSSLSPLSPSLGLSNLTLSPPQWRRGCPNASHNFDIICLQEPWEKEIDAFDHTGYTQITPNCDTRHRVSFYFKEASIPPSCICPRPDLSTSPDLLVVDLIVKGRIIHLVNLYNDCVTRAGVGLVAAVLPRFGPQDEIFAMMDSNSHHILWDSLTLTPTQVADFDLHDLLISHPLTLVTPPDVPTHIPSGNVIDLGFASPSLLWNIRNVEVSSCLGLGSDHLPITYELDLEIQRPTSNRYNPDSMDIDKFLSIL
ncbi:Endonuclease/exonuclease/phosphatase [Mycena rosella]|uniref:Endonuclease/exonuclease/phosphatase n=1 Tax=Mycena rosella TaxID=1033263 RepID=A0AAD7AZ29_MYCRO|nr:Endonuclease/exonuclease/phosphatase [Mycena rosella]